MVDEPTTNGYYGGQVAAPIFSTIVSETLRAMNVAPDSAVKNMVLRDDSINSGSVAPIQKVVLTQ
jgi:cell division protein FtsI (penicillin-binding protein 3)